MRSSHGILLFLTLLLVSPSLEARDAVTTAEINGTFTGRNGSTFDILSVGKDKLQMSFSGIEGLTNTGQATGIADFQGDTAYLRPAGHEKTCTLIIRFLRPGQIQATQNGDSSDCGFGPNVRADGSYRKTSSVKPVIY